MRVRQWTKNLFVFAPLVFSHNLFSLRLKDVFVMAIAFCLSGSAVYFFNDIHDRDLDRLHPVKRLRPVASGRLAVRTAWILAALCGLAGLGLATVSGGWIGLGIASSYLCLNGMYSLRLKRVAYLDVLCIATGFLLRVFAGAAAARVPVSFWIQLNTFLLALFLGFGKRFHELTVLRQANRISPVENPSGADRFGSLARPALGHYHPRTLNALLGILQVLIPMTFLAYTLDPVSARHHHLVFTVPWITLALYRFHRISSEPGKWASPTDRMLQDPWFLLLAAGWAASVMWLLYARPN